MRSDDSFYDISGILHLHGTKGVVAIFTIFEIISRHVFTREIVVASVDRLLHHVKKICPQILCSLLLQAFQLLFILGFGIWFIEDMILFIDEIGTHKTAAAIFAAITEMTVKTFFGIDQEI